MTGRGSPLVADVHFGNCAEVIIELAEIVDEVLSPQDEARWNEAVRLWPWLDERRADVN